MTESLIAKRCRYAAYLLVGFALWLVMDRHLLVALFSGLLVYSLVGLLEPWFAKRTSTSRARLIAVAVLTIVVVTVLTLGIWSAISFFLSSNGHVNNLLQRMADIVERSRDQVPAWISDSLPDDATDLKEMITGWLRSHAIEAQTFGIETGRTAAQWLIGIIIGAMVALEGATPHGHLGPFGVALRDRASRLADAFQRIVFAQVGIAAINATLTAIFLAVLAFSGNPLPFSKTIVIITFFTGLLPVVGNLISNSVLVVIALSVSLRTAVTSLIFMMLIHKLEYFLNARIIGAHIKAHAFELLTVMLVMEALFGLPGVVAAPVFYAYAKRELVDQGLL